MRKPGSALRICMANHCAAELEMPRSGSWLQIAAIKKTTKEEEQRHRQAIFDMAHEVSFSIEQLVWCALDTTRRLRKLGI